MGRAPRGGRFSHHPLALVIIGAVCAGAGRLCLALVTRAFRHRLGPERLANLRRAAGDSVRSHRVGSVLGLALFALSPVPSAQLFEAAGLLDVPLLPLTASSAVPTSRSAASAPCSRRP
jgi:hypothetical protein